LYYILCGEDQFSLAEKLAEIKAELGDPSMLAGNMHELEGERLTVEQLAAVGSAAPFLAPRRLIIIRGLLERFEPREKSAPRKSGAAKIQEPQALAECLKGLPESSLVVLVDTIDLRQALKKNPLYTLLAPHGQVALFPQLKGAALFQWVQERAIRKGGAISRQASGVLIQMLGGDLFTFSNEIDKLTAFAMGRRIEEKDVRQLVSAAQETKSYVLVDAILERRADLSEQILDDLLKSGQNPSQVLNTLARQASIMLQIKEMRLLKKPPQQIQARIGLFNEFAFNKVAAQSQKLSFAALKEIYRKLLDADLAIKTGKLDADLALELLVAELSAS
jgi:DNA polymerase-3 subunit delta